MADDDHVHDGENGHEEDEEELEVTLESHGDEASSASSSSSFLSNVLVSSSQTNNNNNNSSRISSSSIRHCQAEFKSKGTVAAIERAFLEMDMKQNGVLEKSEIAAFMEEAAKTIRLEVDQDIITDAVNAILENVHDHHQHHHQKQQQQQHDSNNEKHKKDTTTTTASAAATSTTDTVQEKELKQYITKEQFVHLFERYPDLLTCFDDEMSIAMKQELSMRHRAEPLTALDQLLDETEQMEVWTHAHTHWKNRKVAWVWTILYVMANIIAFLYKFMIYSRNEDAQAVFGTCINVARGSAQCLNLNCCLILLPMCRHVMTRLRATPLRFYVPFDAIVECHTYIGIVIAILALTHVGAHICDFHRLARADENDIYALFGTKLGIVPRGIPERWMHMLQQPAGITGIIMVVCLLVAYPLTQLRHHNYFNTFWVSHHLLLIMLVALCFHGMGSLLEPFASVYWIMVPLALYMIPRFWRETSLSECKVLDISIKEGDVVGLKLERPHRWTDAHVKAGMYAFINVPHVSSWQWHPFTLTSAPVEKDSIEFHFKAAGDWTKQVHDLLEGLVDESADTEEGGSTRNTKMKNINPHALKVKVEGPIGASSQGFQDYPIVVLIGAGIGVTPMISVLKQLLATPGKMKRTFFYWTVRDRSSFDWFNQLMDEIYESDTKHVIQIRHFLTSVKDDDRDIGAVLLHHAARAQHRKTNFDLILGQYTHHQLQVGRPNWEDELQSIQTEAKELGHSDCGMFLCGPEAMARAISDVSFAMSKEDPNFHFYFTKETF